MSHIKFSLSFENVGPEKLPTSAPKLGDEVPVQAKSNSAQKGDDFKKDENTSEHTSGGGSVTPPKSNKPTELEPIMDTAYKGVKEGTNPDTREIVEAQVLKNAVIDITDIKGDEAQVAAALEQLRFAIECECDESGRVMDTVDNLYAVGNQIASAEELPEEVITATANATVSGTDAAPEDILSVEAFRQNRQLALEGLGDKLASAVTSIADGLLTSAKNTLNFMKFQVAFFNKQKETITSQINALTALKAQKKNISVNGGRFLVNSQGGAFTSFAEFQADLTKTTEFVNQLMVRVEKFTRGTFLSKTKGLLSASPVPGFNYNQTFNDLYKNMTEEFLNPLSQLPGMQKVGGEGSRTDFQSSGLLGGGVLTVSTSAAKASLRATGDSVDAKAVTGASGDLSVKFTVQSGLPRGNVAELGEVTGQQIQQMLDGSRILLQRIDTYNSFVMRWVSFWAGASMFNKLLSPKMVLDAALTQWLFSIARIVRLGGYFVFNMTASTFNYTKQLLDNNIKIANVFLDGGAPATPAAA